MIKPSTYWLLVALTAEPPAFAGTEEARLLASLRREYPATKFDRVEPTPLPHLYAVSMGDNVAYVTPGSLRYMVFGQLVDVQALAAAPASTVGAPSTAVRGFQRLPLQDAIKRVQGNGRRTLVVFTDPACGYCRQLERELGQVPDVTLYYFMVPFLGRELPASIWCAKDREQAYGKALAGMLDSTGSTADCAHPADRNARLAAQWGVHATPTLVFPDGSVHAGWLAAQDINASLAQAGTPSAAHRSTP